jgi:hypothetical protein
MRIPEIVKKPDEKFPIGFKYISPDLEEGATIASCTVTISPSEVGGLAVDGNPVVEADKVSQTVQAGKDGSEYYVTFKVTTSGGHIYEDKIFVKVRA